MENRISFPLWLFEKLERERQEGREAIRALRRICESHSEPQGSFARMIASGTLARIRDKKGWFEEISPDSE